MRVQHRFAPVVAWLRTANPYALDSALAALVLFAVSLQWLFPDEDGDPLSLQGWLLGAGTAVPLVWRRAAPFATAWVVSAATPAMAAFILCSHSPSRRQPWFQAFFQVLFSGISGWGPGIQRFNPGK